MDGVRYAGKTFQTSRGQGLLTGRNYYESGPASRPLTYGLNKQKGIKFGYWI